MKKILIIGSLLAAIAIIAISISQWNAKVDTTTEQAKKEIDTLAEKDPSSVGKSPSSDATNEQAETDSKSESSPSSGGGSDSQPNPTDGANTENKQPTDATGNNEGTTADSTTDSTSDSSPSVPSTTGKTLPEIKAAYRTVFSDLEVQETSKVDQLVVQAKADYVSGKLSKTDLLVKYQDAAVTLERNADQMFNALYGQLQIDLEKNGHDPNAATEFKSEYQTKKQQRLSRIVNQLQGF